MVGRSHTQTTLENHLQLLIVMRESRHRKELAKSQTLGWHRPHVCEGRWSDQSLQCRKQQVAPKPQRHQPVGTTSDQKLTTPGVGRGEDDHQPMTQPRYSMSNVILVEEKFTSFHHYLTYSHHAVPLCLVCQAPSYEPNLTFLAPFPTELAYLSMLK